MFGLVFPSSLVLSCPRSIRTVETFITNKDNKSKIYGWQTQERKERAQGLRFFGLIFGIQDFEALKNTGLDFAFSSLGGPL